MQRAGVDTDSCDELLRDLTATELIELQRGYGRLEPRARYKGVASQPLLTNLAVNHLYIDEGGKSNPEPLVPGPRYFSLGAVALTDEAGADYIRRADEVKQEFFGTNDITFHDPGMRRHETIYKFHDDRARQREFDNALRRLIEETQFTAFGVGIRKTSFESEYADTGIDPYLPTDCYALAITMLLERYVDFIATGGTKHIGRVTFESIGPREDAQHQMQYAQLLLDGSQWVPNSAFQGWLETGCRFMPKCGSHPLELSDMLARDIFEWVGSECTGVPFRWGDFCAKVHCRGDGQMGKFGIKVFPDADIRELIEEHRRGFGAVDRN
ncbi:MAG TPA: hypothetical protein VK821_12195 [Dehalococcoidia bacterium]|nr:hypothetical protein [Dehalococcoidia bacterium]